MEATQDVRPSATPEKPSFHTPQAGVQVWFGMSEKASHIFLGLNPNTPVSCSTRVLERRVEYFPIRPIARTISRRYPRSLK